MKFQDGDAVKPTISVEGWEHLSNKIGYFSDAESPGDGYFYVDFGYVTGDNDRRWYLFHENELEKAQ